MFCLPSGFLRTDVSFNPNPVGSGFYLVLCKKTVIGTVQGVVLCPPKNRADKNHSADAEQPSAMTRVKWVAKFHRGSRVPQASMFKKNEREKWGRWGRDERKLILISHPKDVLTEASCLTSCLHSVPCGSDESLPGDSIGAMTVDRKFRASAHTREQLISCQLQPQEHKCQPLRSSPVSPLPGDCSLLAPCWIIPDLHLSPSHPGRHCGTFTAWCKLGLVSRMRHGWLYAIFRCE